jgi:hypothetical protein
MMSSQIARAVATQSGTHPRDWQYIDGPATGVGAEYWLRNAVDALEAYVCDEQGELTIEIHKTPGRSPDAR